MMIGNWRGFLVRSVLKLQGSSVLRELELLRRIERDGEQVKKLHDSRLRQLLLHAASNTEYYRGVLSDAGVVRDGEVRLENFSNIPFLTKDVIRREGDRLRATSLPGSRTPYENRTGGSTGEPVVYWQDNEYWDVNVATKLYHFEVLGKTLGEPELKVWGSDRDIFKDTGGWTAGLKNFIYNRRIRTCSRLDDEDLAATVDEINSYKPKSIWAYVDGAYTIADYAARNGHALHAPIAIFCGGGTLLPNLKSRIEEAFQAPAINMYGSREMGEVACECREQAGLHIASNSHYVEVINAEGQPVIDEEGDLAITSLCNLTMPFIRYRIGDRGKLTAKKCRCGRAFPLIESVSGRGMESFVTSDGAIVSPIFLITTIGTSFEPGSVKKMQIIQDDYDKVTIKIVRSSDAAEERHSRNLDDIAAKIRSVMGPQCEISYDFVADIPPTKSGKYLYTVCNLQTDAFSSERGA